ncbi:uncharacterized protein LOC121994944 [Zingiber officinale]|uniref:uncharacterized protein LOC121994944 n=1 Tax=Zingiber officinale TaxID=94328 RepID=UPI001C4CC89E|nr:uncharacterized protein LOC121994944 [Zingiber officinale]
MFCSFHQSVTHNTWGCQGLTPIISQPTPKGYRRRSPSPDRRDRHRSTGRQEEERKEPECHHHQRREETNRSRIPAKRNRSSAQEEENRNNPFRGKIGMIARGSIDGDFNRARKSYARRLEIHVIGCNKEKTEGPQISFGPSDLEGVEIPHDDALIIRAVIANNTIHRTFVDTGSSRVCIDFYDLNKAFPKDFYPLPRIDQLVDLTAGCKLICMLDVYQRYHQVSLARENQEKINFITADGIYCYNAMSFGLKNAEATYQRLMNKVFLRKINHNMEVYVDGILIKSL